MLGCTCGPGSQAGVLYWVQWWEAKLGAQGALQELSTDGRVTERYSAPNLSPHPAQPFPHPGILREDWHQRSALPRAWVWMVGPEGLWASFGGELVRERPEVLAPCPEVMGQQLPLYRGQEGDPYRAGPRLKTPLFKQALG